MPWWRGQFEAWQEVLFGLVMLFLGLFVEDRIDQWREQKRLKGWKGWHDDAGRH